MELRGTTTNSTARGISIKSLGQDGSPLSVLISMDDCTFSRSQRSYMKIALQSDFALWTQE